MGRASSDECYDGQQNYKRDDGYAHRCTIRRARVVALDGDFRARLAQFDRRLFASGWGCYGGPCEETLSGLADEYWDLRAAEAGGNPFPISRLPSGSGYQRGDLNLGVRYAGADASGRSWLESAARRERGGVFDFYERSAPLDVEAVLSKAASHEYVVVIAIELDYYLN